MYANQGYAMDFYAMDLSTSFSESYLFNNVNITIQDIGRLYGAMYDEKEIAEASIETIEQALAAQGITDLEIEFSETEFAGKLRTSLMATSNNEGIKMFQKQIYIKNESAYACITATTFEEDKTDEVLALFTAK